MADGRLTDLCPPHPPTLSPTRGEGEPESSLGLKPLFFSRRGVGVRAVEVLLFN